jgi:hypothetical protein
MIETVQTTSLKSWWQQTKRKENKKKQGGTSCGANKTKLSPTLYHLSRGLWHGGNRHPSKEFFLVFIHPSNKWMNSLEYEEKNLIKFPGERVKWSNEQKVFFHDVKVTWKLVFFSDSQVPANRESQSLINYTTQTHLMIALQL